MKHVWILNHYAQEPGGAGGIRHHGIASQLSRSGWSASIIAASTEHATGRQRLSGVSLRKLQDISGVSWLWIRAPQYRGNGIGRIINIFAYTILVLIPGVTRGLSRPDVIVGSSVHPLAAVAGAILARRFSVPFVYEVRDLWPATLIDMGKISSTGRPARILFWLERWSADKASLVIVLMPRAAEYFIALGVPEERILVLTNGADVSFEQPPVAQDNEKFCLMYCGAMGEANSMHTLIAALADVERSLEGGREFICRLIGDGPLRKTLESQAKKLGLRCVSFEGSVPKESVSTLLLEADAFVITLKDMPRLYRFGVSMNKLFDYLAAGRPTVMAGAVPDNPIELSGGGIVVAPESPRELSKAIVKLIESSKADRDEMGALAWEYVRRNHRYSALSEMFASALDSVSEPSNTLGSANG